MDGDATKPLSRWGKIGIVLFFLLLLVFGAHVEQKSAFLTRRMGDLDVFLRAAWAVRNGEDLYAITSDNDWHYLYPPFYAIVMWPLADPPKGADTTGYVPYAVSVAIVYLLNVFCLFLGVHVLAGAVEERAGWQTQPRFCRRWWMLRLWPILVCILPIGHTLMRGQVNLIVLALLCATMACWLRQQNFRAGLWLSLAVCIKLIPVYLLVYPLWKRDGRTLLGCSLGCFGGLVLLPLVAFGPTGTVTHYETYGKAFFGPLFQMTDDDRTKDELATTDTIGVKNAIHNWMYAAPERYTQPMHPAAKAAYFLLGFAMTFLTLWPSRKLAAKPDSRSPYPLACLILLMAIFSPVCHMHYLLFCIPLVMCLLMNAWQGTTTVRVPWLLTICFVVFNATMIVAYLPNLEPLRDLCIALFATLPLWVIPVVQMWCGAPAVAVDSAPQETRRAA